MTPTTQWVWLCACGRGSREHFPNQRTAIKSLRRHQQDNCGTPTGTTSQLTEPGIHKEWATRRLKKHPKPTPTT